MRPTSMKEKEIKKLATFTVIAFTVLVLLVVNAMIVNKGRCVTIKCISAIHEVIVDVHNRADTIEIVELEEKEEEIAKLKDGIDPEVVAELELEKLVRRINNEISQFESLSSSIKESKDIWYEHTELGETIEKMDYMLISSDFDLKNIQKY